MVSRALEMYFRSLLGTFLRSEFETVRLLERYAELHFTNAREEAERVLDAITRATTLKFAARNLLWDLVRGREPSERCCLSCENYLDCVDVGNAPRSRQEAKKQVCDMWIPVQ